MNVYKVMVFRFGNAMVEANSEEEAKELVQNFLPEQIHWNDQNDKMPLFLVAYAELEREGA